MQLTARIRLALCAVGAAALPFTPVVLSNPAHAADSLVSQGRPVTASSEGGSAYAAEYAVDGSTATRWASISHVDPQWIRIDLGTRLHVSKVSLVWDVSCAISYKIQVSDDDHSYSTAYSTSTGNGGTDDATVSASGRYVRMYGTVRCRDMGYSLQEFRVYGGSGPGGTPSPSPSPSPGTVVGVTGHTLLAYSDTYVVQHPYNLSESDRFSVSSGPVYNAWIYKNDKPLKPGSHTGPRTEMRWSDWIHHTEHMWEADVLVDQGSDEVAIMQVKSNDAGEKAYMKVEHGGDVYDVFGGNKVIASKVWGKWFHMSVDYDPVSGLYRVMVNGKTVVNLNHGKDTKTTWYFKNGVYNTASTKSETHFKNIRFWRA
jgi:hypothetical protein